jgi:aminopeptidase-like protein
METGSGYINCNPYGEPHLSKYDLYPGINSDKTRGASNDKFVDDRRLLELVLHTLSHCDGSQDMVALAKRLNVSLSEFEPVIQTLEEKHLLRHKFREP